ncbi:hypothetical protein OC844_006481 [Tilletia horrida]|nr:hypothetical protein OC844_006481 [Tilletia horrida]
MLAMDSSEHPPLAGPSAWHPNSVHPGAQMDSHTYTPIVWSADPDGPTVLTTPSPITLRPTFFTPLPQPGGSHEQQQQQQDAFLGPTSHASKAASVGSNGEMPPPPMRVKMETIQPDEAAHALVNPMHAQLHAALQQQFHHQHQHQQQQQQLLLSHHQAESQQRDQHHHTHASSLIPQPHLQPGLNHPIPSPIFHPGAFGGVPMNNMSMDHSGAFTLETNALGGPFDPTQQQPRNWNTLPSPTTGGAVTPITSIIMTAQNMSMPSDDLSRPGTSAMSIAPSIGLQHEPSSATQPAQQQHQQQQLGTAWMQGSQGLAIDTSNGLSLASRPGADAAASSSGSRRSPEDSDKPTDDVNSPFAHNCDHRRQATAPSGSSSSSLLSAAYAAVPPSTASSSSHQQEYMAETRLRTSPSGNASIGMGMGGISLAMGIGLANSLSGQHATLRRPHTAAPQGSSNNNGRSGVKNGQLFFQQKHPFSTAADADGLGAGSVGDREKERKQSSRFVQKLYTMVHDPDCQHLISWNSGGTSVVIVNFDEFAKDVLGKHFKHSNFSSFIRQLNMYGFYKVNKIPRGSRQSTGTGPGAPDGQIWEFSHPKFQRNRPDLLEEIKRRAIDSDAARMEGKGDAPMSAHAQANAYLSSQVKELTGKVDALNVGNAELRNINSQLRDALQSSLALLRQHCGGDLPEGVAQHEKLLVEPPMLEVNDGEGDAASGTAAAGGAVTGQDANSANGTQPANSSGPQLPMPPSSNFVTSPGWSLRARTNTANSQMSICRPGTANGAGPSSSSSSGRGRSRGGGGGGGGCEQDSPVSASASMTALPLRDSQGTITPFPRPSVLESGPPISSSGPISSSVAAVSRSETNGTMSVDAPGTSVFSTTSRSTVTVDGLDSYDGSRAGTGLSSTADSTTSLFSTGAGGVISTSHPFSFAPPFTPSHSDGIAPSICSAPPSELMTHSFITGNASVDSLQQLQPSKQQRMMHGSSHSNSNSNTNSSGSCNLPSTVVGLPPPRSSSLMAKFDASAAAAMAAAAASAAAGGGHSAGHGSDDGSSGVSVAADLQAAAAAVGAGEGNTSTTSTAASLLSNGSSSQLGMTMNDRVGGVASASASGHSSSANQSLLSPSASSLAPSSLLPGGPASGLSAFTAADSSSTRSSLLSFGPGSGGGAMGGSNGNATMSSFGTGPGTGAGSSMVTSSDTGSLPSPPLRGQIGPAFTFEGNGMGQGLHGYPQAQQHHQMHYYQPAPKHHYQHQQQQQQQQQPPPQQQQQPPPQQQQQQQQQQFQHANPLAHAGSMATKRKMPS